MAEPGRDRSVSQPPNEEILGSVESVCSTCLNPVAAAVVDRGGAVWLLKECPTHGREEVLESSSRDFYRLTPERTCCQGIGCCEPQATGPQRSNPPAGEPIGPSCVTLFEITDRCNLSCPVCFASSAPSLSYLMSLDEFRARLRSATAKRGALDIVMLSGGEPTTHPEFELFLEELDRSPLVKRVLLNTNGVLIAHSAGLRSTLERLRSKLEVYLQFDGTEAETSACLRGDAELLPTKRTALEKLAELKLPVTLAVTMTPALGNNELGTLLDTALSLPHVRGVTFQPAFRSGRFELQEELNQRLTTPDIVSRICAARPEVFRRDAFTNLPCSHPNCAIVAYFYRASGTLWPLCSTVSPDESLRDRIDFTLEDLMQCGCDTTELGQFIRGAELSAENSFRIVIKPFMDRFTLNRARTELCCTHVVGPEGRLMSFCEYNVFRQSLNWNRNGELSDSGKGPGSGKGRLRMIPAA